MNKNLYIILILFLGLSVACNITNSIFYLQAGVPMLRLHAYNTWFIMANIAFTIGSILLLKYYYYRNYLFAFFSGIIGVITTLTQSAILYNALAGGSLVVYYAPARFISLSAVILYAISLIFSEARKRIWLKLAGISSAIIGAVLLSILIYSRYAHLVNTNILAKVYQWTAMAGWLVLVLFIMNFLSELKLLKGVNTSNKGPKAIESIFGLVWIITFVFTVLSGASLASENSTEVYWQHYNAQQAQLLVNLAGGPKVFFDSKRDSLHYLLIKPLDFNPKKKYPLVVCLPYGGYEAAAAELLTVDTNRRLYPAFIFVPYCLQGTGWGGIPGTYDRDSLACEAISALADSGIDVNRRYVTGVSRGGYGTWQFICKRPNMFAAAIPISGGGNTQLASKIVNIPVWAFHGAKDKNVSVSVSRDMIAAIKKAGGHPRYTEFPDQEHNIWDPVSRTPGLLAWLFAQKRK